VQREYAFYEPRKAIFSQPFVKEADKVEETRKDFFCDSEKRAKQLIFEGRNVNVYYDYAPLGVPLKKGEPAVHFLIAPKAHRENFYSLTKWEYLETSLYASALNEHYTKEREADCYHIHRTGRRLQSVWHHHQHFHANPREKDFGVKMTVLSKMLLGGRVLPPAELQKSVDELRPHVESLLSPLRVRAMELEQSSEKVHLRSKL
jgi:diadenosine tetraphosphate (Ap4A) HIT family hydrolase